MAQISIANLNFSYDGSQEQVFENLTVSFDSKWKLGLVSRNGRGKTTLLKLLSQQLRPNNGSISIPYGAIPVMFPPPVDTFSTENTIDVLESILPELEEWKLYRELEYLDTDSDLLQQSFCTVSPGEQGKILLASLFASDDTYVLLDEPGNHLDAAGKRILTNYLSVKKGFLLVSHEREMLDTATDHTMAILKSGPEIVAGEYHVWAAHRKNIEAFELAENDRLEKEISSLNASTHQSRSWAEKAHRDSRKEDGTGLKMGVKEYRRGKAAKLERRANQTTRRKEKAADDKSQLLHDIETAEALRMNPISFHNDLYVNVIDLSLSFGSEFSVEEGDLPSAHADKVLMENLSFQVRQGERLCISGSNGTGKSTLLHLLSGIEPPTSLTVTGRIDTPKGLKISMLPQKSELPDLPLMEFIDNKNLDPTKLLMLLRKMDFPRETFHGDVSSFSSGQKRKLLLAMSLCEEAHLYLWDEPLNYLDIQSREQVENVLLEASPTLVFVEHDNYFCSKIETSRLTL